MSVVVLGVSHKTAPIKIRERLAFEKSEIKAVLHQLKTAYRGAEFVLLSTCNRVELYCSSKRAPERTVGWLMEFLSSFHSIERERFEPFLYHREDEEAVRHLLLVSAGLDSMVVGETQILGQVKESYRLACGAKSTGKTLNRLFHCAFSTAKDIHTTTSISDGRVSVASVAVELALHLFADIARAKVVVVGAGDTGELVVRHLLTTGCTDVTVVNRSYERGVDLAKRSGIGVAKWEELGEQIGQANVVISSAATQDYLYDRGGFEKTIGRRRRRALLIIDLGVPRNFEPAINRIEDVYLYSIDELKEIAERNLKAREKDVANALEIVHASATDFMEWYHAKDLGPLIGRMKAECGQIGRDELERFFIGPRQDASCRPLTEAMVNRLVNKLLHCIITGIDTVAKETGSTEAARLVDMILWQARNVSRQPEDGKEVPA